MIPYVSNTSNGRTKNCCQVENSSYQIAERLILQSPNVNGQKVKHVIKQPSKIQPHVQETFCKPIRERLKLIPQQPQITYSLAQPDMHHIAQIYRDISKPVVSLDPSVRPIAQPGLNINYQILTHLNLT